MLATSYCSLSARPLRPLLVEAWWLFAAWVAPLRSVRIFDSRFSTPAAELLVISDDLDLPFGRLRMRASGGSGGHNGLKSVIAHFGEAFPRVRVGIGRGRSDTIDYVLASFAPAEEHELATLIGVPTLKSVAQLLVPANPSLASSCFTPASRRARRSRVNSPLGGIRVTRWKPTAEETRGAASDEAARDGTEGEAGSSWHKTEHLKEFLTLCVQQPAVPAGREAGDIRALLHAAHQKVILDGAWRAALLYRPALNHPVAYVAGAGHDTQILFAALLELLLIIANIGTAVVPFSIYKRQSEPLALGFVTARVMESTFIAVGILCMLALVTLRQDLAGTNTDPATLATVGRSPVAVKDWTFVPGPPLLRTERLTRAYGSLLAVNGVDFVVHEGELRSIIGPNGAGKTTLFNVVTGVLAPSSGQVRLFGTPVPRLSPRRVAALGVARTFQHARLLPRRAVLENVALGAHLSGKAGLLRAALRLDRAEEARLLATARAQAARVGLGAALDLQAGELPHGQQRLVELARALCLSPRLLLLDEPAAGLRLPEKQRLAALLRQLRAEGMGVLLVEHDMDFVMRLADRVVVMDFGQKIAEGPPERVQSDPAVLEAYLGVPD